MPERWRGCTPLHFSAYRLTDGDGLPIIQALLGAGADPNVTADNHGETPLFWAMRQNIHSDIRVLEALLNGGANPAVRNNSLDTPLHTACRYGRLEAVQVLIRRQGPECLTFKNNWENTPLDQLSMGQDYFSIPGGSRKFHPAAYSTSLRRNDSSARRSSRPSLSSSRGDLHSWQRGGIPACGWNAQYGEPADPLGISHCHRTRLGARLGP